MNKEKLKKLFKDYKVLIVMFFVCLLLLTVEIVVINKKPKNKLKEEKVVKKELSEQEKKVLGVEEEKSIANETEKQIAKRVEEKEKEDYSDNYKKYEKLSDEEKEKIDTIPSKENVSIDELDNINDNEQYNKIDNIPNKFKLTDKVKMNFENQGGYGLCWDFSSIKSLETYLELHNLGEYNFSEIHVDYVMSNLLFGGRSIHDGGTFEYLVKYSSINEGFVDTKKLEYEKDYTKEEYLKFKDIEKVPYIITDYVHFPTLNKKDGKFYDREKSDTPLTEEQMNNYIETLKKHIMTNGGIEVSIFSEEFMAPEGRSYYSPNDTAMPDHGITIVGWDDTYSKEKFMSQEINDEDRKILEDGGSIEYKIQEIHPNKDGAFIAVNSWSDEEEYYYISYEDPTVYSNMFGVTSVGFEDAIKLSDYSENFQNLLRRELSTYIVKSNGEEYITKASAGLIYSLDLSNGGQLLDTDLKALNYFKNLYSLNLSSNNLSSLEYLPNLNNLSFLNVSNNKLDNVDNLNNFKELFDVNLSNNNIKDISNLKSKQFYSLILSGNKGVTGYEYLKTDTLILTNCNINRFSSDNEYSFLDLSDNPNIIIDKINKINALAINNSNLKSLDFIKYLDVNSLQLELKNNEIESIKVLEGKNISYLDLSGNKSIKDLDSLEKIFTKEKYNEMKNNYGNIFGDEEDNSENDNIEASLSKVLTKLFSPIKKYDENEQEEQEEYNEYGYYDFNTLLVLNDCDIDNINIFKNVYVTNLSLINNKITSTGEFKNDSINSIDLSNNKFNDKSYIELINNFDIVYLKNCGISDISGLDSIENNTLDLSDNLITDITPLKNFKIENLSLANNKIETGNISDIKGLNTLNISGCNISNDSFDINDFEDLYSINISNNDYFNNYDSLLESEILNTIYIGESNLDFSKVIDKESKYIYGTFYLDLKSNNKLINIDPNSYIYDLLRQMYYDDYSINYYFFENGYANKYVENIIVNDESKEVIFNAKDNLQFSSNDILFRIVLNK